LTLEEKKAMPYSHVFILCQNPRNPHYNKFLEVKVNGASKIWKRSPDKVRIPYKYGMYEFGYITELDEVRVPAECTCFSEENMKSPEDKPIECPVHEIIL
jgi:hypothetical protein